MLDVGCGTCWISALWVQRGARVTGLEPSKARAALARKRGLRVINSYIENIVRHVLEHLEHPSEILRKLSLRLSRDGILLIVVPNIQCVGRKLFNTDWTWVLPLHSSFISPDSLAALVDRSGYNTIELYQTASPIWYPDSFLRRFPRLGGILRTGVLSMLMLSPIALLGNFMGMGDNLTVIARRAS
jgi:SAM-dependent methyltransferase